ncbi:MAG TPA: ABC transporter substrate-binding protein [Roseiflexaceae bacterium]|nr:ABC transporter substrate-binding protein [Roseiflexaceae bacterium]
MQIRRFPGFLAIGLLLCMLLAACGQAGQTGQTGATSAPTSATAVPAAATSAPSAGGAADKVTLQLKWVAQAQFAGYYAALDQGFYTAENLDVTIRPGGPDIAPEQVVASGQAEFGIDWLASLLAVREQGTPLVNIAQVYSYAGMRQLAWKDSGIQTPADLKGKKVAVWFFGNEFNLLATLNKYGIDKDKDIQLVQQPFDMNLLLNREVDSAAAMTYNELYQVLSAGHTVDELNIIDYNKEGTAMPEDGIFTSQEWLDKDPRNPDIAARFLRASFKGWEFCRDNVDACVDIVLKNDASGVMTKEAQKWQLDEVNKLVWGDPIDKSAKIGYMDPALFKRGAETALKFGVIKNPAEEAAYTHTVWELANK